MGGKPKPRSSRRLLYPVSITITAYMRQGWESRKVSKNTCGEVHTKQKGSVVCAGAAGARRRPPTWWRGVSGSEA